MILETERLRIIPLSVSQFKLLLDGIDKMEKELGLSSSGENMDEHTQQAMEGLYQKALNNEDNYIWYTNWQIILKSDNISIGSACFMGSPNENKEVEIGYGTNSKFRNQGYMTEAVSAICSWLIEQQNIAAIVAETDKDNSASHKVLKKCGFIKQKETEGSYFWRLNQYSDPGI